MTKKTFAYFSEMIENSAPAKYYLKKNKIKKNMKYKGSLHCKPRCARSHTKIEQYFVKLETSIVRINVSRATKIDQYFVKLETSIVRISVSRATKKYIRVGEVKPKAEAMRHFKVEVV